MDYSNFSCINYRTPLPFGRPPGINALNYQKDVDKLCLSPGEFGCAQFPLDREEINGNYGISNPYQTYEEAQYTIRRPSNIGNSSSFGFGAGVLETFPSNDPSGGTLEQGKNHHSIYQPVPFNTPSDPPDDGEKFNFMISQTFNYGASFYLPSYIQKDNILRVEIVYFNDGSSAETASSNSPNCDDGVGGDCVIEIGNCSNNCLGCTTKRECLIAGGSWDDSLCNITTYAAPDIKSITENSPRPNEDPLGPPDIPGVDEAAFCIADEGGYDVFHFGGRQNITPGIGINWQYGGVRIIYNPINTRRYEVCFDGSNVIQDSDREQCIADGNTWDRLENMPILDQPRAMNPGNTLYYTSKLARLELLGIPQIAYEPIYCNSDWREVIPGIFDSGLGTKEDWASNANTFNYRTTAAQDISPGSMYDSRCVTSGCGDPIASEGARDRAVLKDKVNLPDIWSENEFKCCRETNLETDAGSNCCSGFAVDINGVLTCKLPPGTNLNLFFNKFVSGEGMSDYIEENTRLTDDDFVPETGEPKLNEDVEQKLVNLGALFCSSGTVRAGATDGFFFAEPNNEVYYHQTQVTAEQTKYRSIIDTNLDFDSDNDTGAFRFNEGFRWSHHIYCQ